MERCKHCGEVVDRTDFIYCPACGKLLSDEGLDKKDLKKLKKQESVQNKNAGVVKNADVAVTKTKKIKEHPEGGEVRVSYIVFGIFALIIGVLLILTSGYWGANTNLFGQKFAEKMYDLSQKLLGKTIDNASEGLKLSPKITRGVLFFSVYCLIMVIISVITFFSLFTKRTTAGHVFIKIGSLILIDFIVVYSFVGLAAFSLLAGAENSELLTPEQMDALSDFLVDSEKLLESTSLYCTVGGGVFLIIGIILSITKFGHPYNTTFYQHIRAFFFLACSALYYLIIAKKLIEVKFVVKLTNFMLVAIPYYLVIISFCMFFSAKTKKSE